MSMYDLNPTNPTHQVKKNNSRLGIIILILVSLGLGALGQTQLSKVDFSKFALPNISLPSLAQNQTDLAQSSNSPQPYTPQTTQEDAVINVVKEYSPAVVSIVITKDMPIYEQQYYEPFGGFFGIQIPQIQQKGTQQQEVGAGTGFIINSDGLILTNRHVVGDSSAQYTVSTIDGKEYTAKVLALDPVNDIALIKIDRQPGQTFTSVKLGDSSRVQIGQTVIAIGNALGEFNNTVSVGVVSGLQRNITAAGGGTSEALLGVIQTDAAINEGNSGGPLLNLKGEVIGVNTAMASGAQSISFVTPINVAKRDIDQVQKGGKISYPYLGINYTMVTKEIQADNQLPVDYGAWITSGTSQKGRIQSGVVASSPAASAGLKDGDIILEFNGEKVTQDNTLSQLIAKYNPGDKVTLKVLRDKNELTLSATLGERPSTQ